VSVDCHQHTTQYARACTNAKFEVFHVLWVRISHCMLMHLKQFIYVFHMHRTGLLSAWETGP